MERIRAKTLLLGVAFGLSSIAAVALGFLVFDTKAAVQVVREFGYWILLINTVLFVFALHRLLVSTDSDCLSWKRLNEWPSRMVRSWREVAFVLVSWLVVLGLQTPGFKIVMDEYVLASTALRMHEHREAMATARAHEIQGVFTHLEGYVDKRPNFFPFLVSAVHDLTGFRSLNPIILNGLLSLLLLIFCFLLGNRLRRPWGGHLAVLFLVSLPLFSMMANSGGFAILNALMILITAVLAERYLRDPDVRSMNALLLATALLAQVRYESALFVVAVCGIVLVGWYWKREILLSKTAVVVPLLFVPYALQRLIFSTDYEPWELREGSTEAFAWSHIPHNLDRSIHFFFSFGDTDHPNSYLLGWFFLLSLIAVFALVARGHFKLSLQRNRPEWLAYGAVALVAIANFFLLMTYHWGQLSDIMATRIAFPFFLFQIFLIVGVLSCLNPTKKILAGIFALVGLQIVGVTVPLCARSDFLQFVPGQHEAAKVHEWGHEYGKGRTLFISDRHLASIAARQPAIVSRYAKRRKGRVDFHLRLNTYDNIYFIYRTNFGAPVDSRMVASSVVENDFVLEPIESEKLGKGRYITIARVVGVKWQEGEEPLVFVPEEFPSDDPLQLKIIAETLP